LALPTRAVRDAPPASGRFPVVLYSLGSAALGQATQEYLASHGYVVVQMPRLGAQAGLPDTGRDRADLDAKLRDMDFLVNAIRELPAADVQNMGVVGFSAGGGWGLSMAMKHSAVRAVVSLDTVMLFDDDTTRAWRQMPIFDLEAVRAPVLHVIRKPWVAREDPKLWDGLRHADRWVLRFDDERLDHLDFQSIGHAITLVGGRADLRGPVSHTFHVALFGEAGPQDAIALFSLNVEAFPASANALDSLADAYVAVGDVAKAREVATRALPLLDADTQSSAERKELIRASLRQKLDPAP